MDETGVSGENHRPAASRWQTLSHNVVSNIHRLERDSNLTLVVICTDYTGSCKSNYHMITTTTATCVKGFGVCPMDHTCQPSRDPQKIVFQKDAKWCILLHFGYKICSVETLNIVWKNHDKMEISTLHIYKSNLGPSNSDGSNTMDGSNLFESPANFPYIFKLKKIFRSNTDTSNSRT